MNFSTLRVSIHCLVASSPATILGDCFYTPGVQTFAAFLAEMRST